MVVPTDVQFSFIAAAFFADVGSNYILGEYRESPERFRAAKSRYQLRALLFPTLFVAPAAMTFMLAWPGWETQYWAERAEQTLNSGTNGLIAGVFLAAMVLAAILGNWFGFRCVVRRQVGLLRLVYLAVLSATVFILLVQWPAPVRLGTVTQFRSDPASLPFIWENGHFFTMLVALSIYCAVPVIVFYVLTRRESARASSASGG